MKSNVKKQFLEFLRQDSFTISELCAKLSIDRTTYYRWLRDDAGFKDDVEQARNEFKEKITIEAKKSLRRLVQGYDYTETHIVQVAGTEVDEHGKPIPVIKEQKTVKKHVPPNTGAVIFALTNGDPDQWQQKGSFDINAKVKGDVTNNIELPDDILFEIADRIQDYEHQSRETDTRGIEEEAD